MTIDKTEMKWYVIRTQSNREKSVTERLIKESQSGELVGKVGKVIIPIEKVIELDKKGKRVEKEKIMLPGYIFLETNSLGELKYFLKGVKGTSGFLAERNGSIQSLTEEEVDKMMGKHKEASNVDSLLFMTGEEVVITEGPFTSMKAVIEDIKDQKVTLTVSIFGRKTPLTLELSQINKMLK